MDRYSILMHKPVPPRKASLIPDPKKPDWVGEELLKENWYRELHQQGAQALQRMLPDSYRTPGVYVNMTGAQAAMDRELRQRGLLSRTEHLDDDYVREHQNEPMANDVFRRFDDTPENQLRIARYTEEHSDQICGQCRFHDATVRECMAHRCRAIQHHGLQRPFPMLGLNGAQTIGELTRILGEIMARPVTVDEDHEHQVLRFSWYEKPNEIARGQNGGAGCSTGMDIGHNLYKAAPGDPRH
jgi:hypothetical protein